MSPRDPGCVKTCTSQECAELFSLSSSLSGGRKHFWFSNLRNRDGISTRRLNVGVFTRPRPIPDITPAYWQPVAVRAVPCLSGNRNGPDSLQRSSSAHGRNG